MKRKWDKMQLVLKEIIKNSIELFPQCVRDVEITRIANSLN